MPKFRKKPVIIEAEHLTVENRDRAFHFIRCNCRAEGTKENPSIIIQTLEGDMTAQLGDWIIKGVKGEFYPCKPAIFDATYESPEDPVETV